jgi:multicomponent Na+:H+ antiporter subunit E
VRGGKSLFFEGEGLFLGSFWALPAKPMYRLFVFILLMLTWVAFSGFFDPIHLTLGVISSAFVTWISADFLFPSREVPVGARVGQGIRLVAYLVWLLWQVVLSNLHLLRLTLGPGGMAEVKPSIVHFKTGLRSDFEKFLLANSITLTPGTVTMKILGDDFYVHAISEAAAAGLDGEMERRIAWIFSGDRSEGKGGASS